MVKTFFITILIFTVSLTADEWLSFRGAPNNPGIAKGSISAKPTLKWKFQTEGNLKGTAVVKDGFVYFGSEDEKVYCLKLENGEKVWEKKVEDIVEASPLILGDSIIIGTGSGQLYRLNRKNGDTIWTFKAEDRFAGGANYYMQGDKPVIIAGNYDNFIYAINFDDGKKIWAFETENYVNGTPAIYEDKIIFGGCDNMIYMLNRKGELTGEIDLGSYIAGTVGIEKGFAYIGHYDNKYFKIDLENKKILWHFKRANFPFFSSPAIGEDIIIFGSRDKRVYGVKKDSGEKIWDFKTRGKVDSSPLICGDKTAFGSYDGRVYILERDTGKLLWKYEIGKPIIAAPSIVDGHIIIGASDNILYVFK
ncbi:MAG: PQQ-binding-like beta-propeller repeat protein [Lentisphaeraceae bacterium]|nr:PQQ-binding-like beta-propeller repeat protein [Lentisphaeraceae bacterium]